MRPARGARVYIKLKPCNPTASYRDCMALTMIEAAEARGRLCPSTRGEAATVVKAISGNTSMSFAMVCAAKGCNFVAVTSDVFAQEKLQSMTAFRDRLDIIESESGKIDKALKSLLIQRARS